MDDLLADLPTPRDDEPVSLRQDILDELSDHLSCALHRELVKSGDPQVAEARVLDRFGDPRRIAVQLWFQAMWSRIMLQRVSMGLQGLLVVGVLAVAVLLTRMLEFQTRIYDDWQALKNQSANNQAMLVQLIQRLPQPAAVSEGGGGFGMAAGMGGEAGGIAGMMPAGGDMGGAMGAMGGPPSTPPNLVIQVADPVDASQPAKGYFLKVEDENGQGIPSDVVGSYGDMGMGAMGGGMGSMPGMPSANPSGVTFTFDGHYIRMRVDEPQPKGIDYVHVAPGRYTALIEFPDGRVGKQRFAVLPKETKTVTIECPPPVEASLVTIEGPKLENIEPGQQVLASLSITRPPQKLKNTDWTLNDSPQWHVQLDLTTGLVTSLLPSGKERREIKFDPDEPQDLRFLSLKSGGYQVWWQALTIHRAGKTTMNYHFDDRTTQLANPGATTWTLTLPDTVRQRLAETLNPAPVRADEPEVR